MPLAKTSDIFQEKPKETPLYRKPDSESFKFYDFHNPEFYRYFNLNPVDSTGNSHFEYIVKWASDGAKGVADALQKIRAVERKIGSSNTGDTKLSKIFNYIRMDDSYRATSKEMRGKLESVQAQHRIKLAEIREAKREKMSKINEEIGRIEKEYKTKSDNLKKYFSGAENEIKNEYASQLKELKGIKSIYGR